MKFAIIADIHANLQALQAVLADMKQQGCTDAACLGDIVGYNANPKECFDIIRGMNIPCVKGNHDEYCSTDTPLDGFNPKAAYVTYDLDSKTIELRRVAFEAPPGDSGSAPLVTKPNPPKPIAAKRAEDLPRSE